MTDFETHPTGTAARRDEAERLLREAVPLLRTSSHFQKARDRARLVVSIETHLLKGALQ